VMHFVKFALKKLWQNVRNDRVSLVVNVLVLTLTFFSVVVVGVGVANVTRLTANLEDRYQINVYLEQGVSEERVEEVASGLAAVQGVRNVEHVDPASFREGFLEVSGESAAGLEDVSLEVFPSVLAVQLDPDYREQMDLASVASKVSQIDAVESVETHEGWMSNIKGLASILGLVALVFGASILVCAVFIVANTIKLAFIKRQPVVEVMRLFGATRALIEAPVLIEGFLQGLTGSLVAVLVGWGLVALLDSRLDVITGGMITWHVSFVPWLWVVVFLGLCGGVGVLGAHMASTRALRA